MIRVPGPVSCTSTYVSCILTSTSQNTYQVDDHESIVCRMYQVLVCILCTLRLTALLLVNIYEANKYWYEMI